MLRKAYLLLLVLVLIPYISHAETKTIYETNKYVMGDNDSKNDARRMCFLEAKRKVLEKAGTYIESHTQVKNYKLEKDEINSYSAALLKVETVKEEWKFIGENMAIYITVKAEVDTSYIEKQLAKITKDTSVQKKIKDQQRQLQELERTVTDLQKQLGSVNSTKAAVLRKERNVVFKLAWASCSAANFSLPFFFPLVFITISELITSSSLRIKVHASQRSFLNALSANSVRPEHQMAASPYSLTISLLVRTPVNGGCL